MIFKYTLDFLPFVLLILMIFIPNKKGMVTNIAPWLVCLYVVILILSIAEYPNDPSNMTDRDRYETSFFNISAYGLDFEYKDVGWVVYNVVCVKLFGDNIFMLWLITAIIYVMSYYSFAASYMDKRKIAYFLVMTTGLIGFTGYGTNTLRQGMATAFVLYSLRKDTKLLLKIVLLIVAMSFHKSIVLLIVSLFISRYIKNFKYYIYFWGVCLTLSLVNFNISSVLGDFAFLDDRVTSYGESIGDTSGGYKTGFRLDFLLYSILPLIFSYIYYSRYSIRDDFYNYIVRIYIFANAIWILVIRIPFSDRVAYLSWFLIPIMTLYPLFTYPYKFQEPQKRVVQMMGTFMSINMLLVLRSYLM